MELKDVEYRCEICGAVFARPEQLRGHMVGKHTVRTYKRGKDHPRWVAKIDHGTIAGYQKEIRRGIKPCRRCQLARAEYVRNRKQKKND